MKIFMLFLMLNQLAYSQFETELSSGNPKEHDLSSQIFPYRKKKISSLTTGACQKNEMGFRTCKRDGTEEYYQFSVFQNENLTQRVYDFGFEDYARSDLHLYVVDSPDDFASNMTFNYYVFLPRTFLPSINTFEEEIHITISTGEKIIFDKKNW